MAKDTIKLTKIIIYIIQGAIIGVGAILPGISGGVLCVAFGLYEPVMELCTSPIKAIKKNYLMFIPFIVGWALGFVLLAKAAALLFEFAPDIALLLFFGLVGGTLPSMFKKSENSDKKASWTPLVISMSVAYIFFHVIEILGEGEAVAVPANFFSFLFCGFMWGMSLIVPGLTSSTLLTWLGLYAPFSEGVGNFDFAVILPFVLGIIITVLLLARLVNMLYKKHYAVISRIILGFVIASSLKALPREFTSPYTMLIAIICCALGFFVAWVMEKHESKQQ